MSVHRRYCYDCVQDIFEKVRYASEKNMTGVYAKNLENDDPIGIYYSSSSYPTIICDNGTFSLKVGFSWDDRPRSIIPTIVGVPRNEMNIRGYGRRFMYVGQHAEEKRGILNTSRPIKKSIITDWDAMETIWTHMFYEDLMVPPENFNILHTESFDNPSSCREKLVELMFELFAVPSMVLKKKSILALFGVGKTTGLVVDSGYECTRVVPVYEGLPFSYAVRFIPIGGWHVTRYLQQLLNERGYRLTTAPSWDIVKRIKESLCYCALDFKKELATFSKDKEKQYVLPDGMEVKISTEAFRPPEVLFDSALVHSESRTYGIHRAIYEAIRSSNVTENANMLRNIVLTGGTTLVRSLPDRLKTEVEKLFLSTDEIAISARPEREFSTWIGGSILASSQNFPMTCVDRNEYDEQGASVVHGKCFF